MKDFALGVVFGAWLTVIVWIVGSNIGVGTIPYPFVIATTLVAVVSSVVIDVVGK